MKVFISSLIGGFERERAAARRAVTTLRHEPVMAEDFGALPSSPQVACLNGLRGSDVVVLILGERYGFVPAGSTISATHQEYRDARGAKPVIAFVQQGVTPEPEQAAFIDEVEAWEGGLFRGGFTSADDLQDGITRALHDYTLSVAVGPVDEQEMAARAVGLIPEEDRHHVSSTFLDIAVVGGPVQRLLRPSDMEDQQLVEHLQQTAMFGDHRLFDRSRGSDSELAGSDLVVQQDRGASIRLTEQGSIAIRVPLDEPQSGRGSMGGMTNMMVIVEEVVQQRLGIALGYATSLLERLDSTQRLTRIAIAARIAGADYRAWRTRSQNAANSNSVQIGHLGQQNRGAIVVNIARAALRLDRSMLIDDIIVPLRRQFPTG